MPQQSELEELLRAVEDLFDHTAPETWKRLIDDAYARISLEDLEQLWQTRFDPQVTSFFNDYLEWKALFGMIARSDGSAYQRRFFRDLLKTSPEASLFQLEAYQRECVATLLREIISGFQHMELGEAEKINDAGFERHHPGGYEEAIKYHDQAIARSPDFSLAWVNKGIALKNLNRFEEAIACYDHIIEHIDAEYKKAWHNKGVALKTTGKIGEAIVCFDKALQLDANYELARRAREECLQARKAEEPRGFKPPEDPGLLSLLEMANSLIGRGNWSAAAKILKNVLDKDPDNPSYLTLLGEALVESGDMQQGEIYLQKAIDLDADAGFAWLNIMRCNLARRDFHKALEQGQRACELLPDHPMPYANRASALLGLQRFQEAAESAKKSLALDDHNCIALYNLGASLWSLGDNDNAARVLRQFVQWCGNSPALESAKSILAAIY